MTDTATVTAPIDDRIEIDPNRIRMLEKRWVKRWKRKPTRLELQTTVDAWIREEVFFREAMKRGLDRNDELVRRRLVQKMEHLSSGLARSEPPTDDELNAFYEENQVRFRLPARRSFTHVFFSKQRRGEQVTEDALEAFVAFNDVLSDVPADSVGDRSMLPSYFAQVSEEDVRHEFGPHFAAALFEARLESWQGPIESAYGLHLVYIHEEVPSRLPPLEDTRTMVAAELLDTTQRKAIESVYESLREHYEIFVAVGRPAEDSCIDIAGVARRRPTDDAELRDSGNGASDIYSKINAILPPRDHATVPGTAEGPAPAVELELDDEGCAAWEEHIVRHQDAELAIGEGPAARSTLLEPAPPDDVLFGPERYDLVLEESARGLTAAAGRPVAMSEAAGWIGVICDNTEMATWVMRSLIAENLTIRREGATVFLPVGAGFHVDDEVAAFVAAAAKVFHYWDDHIAASDHDHE